VFGRPTFAQSVMKLLGHVVGGAVLFIGLAAVAWLVGIAIAKMDATHRFDPAVLQVLHGVEVALLFLDVILTGIVLLTGAVRFIREITGRSRHEYDF
jgi:uncharacterized membrane protein YidH (DUF202 family)